MHYIQELILKKLVFASSRLKYSDLRIADIENDLFNYHLQTLVKNGLVEKSESGYELSPAGKQYVENSFEMSSYRPRTDTFRLYAHGIIIRKDSKNIQILNRERLKHPFYGDKGIIGSTVKKGETGKQYLKARFAEQLGVTFSENNIHYAGTIRKINLLQDGSLFSDTLFTVYFCVDYENDIQWGTEHTQNIFWATLDEAIENERTAKTKLLYLVDILTQLKTKHFKEIIPQFVEEIETILSF